MLADERRPVPHHVRREQAEPQPDRSGPWERVLEQDLLAVVPGIAAEQLVGALSGKAHGRAAFFHFRTEQQQRGIHVRHAGQIAGVGRGQKRGAQRLRFNDNVMVRGMQRIRHHFDIRVVAVWLEAAFCKILVVVAVIDRPGVQGFAARGVVPGGQHGQDGGVQPAGQEAGQRHVGHELALRRVADQFPCAFDRGLQIVRMLVRLQLPVCGVRIMLGSKDGIVAGQQGVDLPEHAGSGRPRRTEQQQGAQAVLVDHRFDLRMAQHRADGRAEHQPAARMREEQGLDAQPVAAQGQAAFGFLPDGESKNSVEPRERIRTPFQKGVQHNLGIRMAGKAMAAQDKLVPDLLGII
ncbi:hypothetical protein AGATL06_21650 [Agathobaculum sp. TL06]